MKIVQEWRNLSRYRHLRRVRFRYFWLGFVIRANTLPFMLLTLPLWLLLLLSALLREVAEAGFEGSRTALQIVERWPGLSGTLAQSRKLHERRSRFVGRAWHWIRWSKGPTIMSRKPQATTEGTGDEKQAP